jgi:hypothetical protein
MIDSLFPYSHTEAHNISFDVSFDIDLFDITPEVVTKGTAPDEKTYYFYEIVNLLDYAPQSFWSDYRSYLEDKDSITGFFNTYHSAIAVSCSAGGDVVFYDDNHNYEGLGGLTFDYETYLNNGNLINWIETVKHETEINEVNFPTDKLRLGIMSSSEEITIEYAHISLALTKDRGVPTLATINGSTTATHSSVDVSKHVAGGDAILSPNNAKIDILLENQGSFNGNISANLAGDDEELQSYYDDMPTEDAYKPIIFAPFLLRELKIEPSAMTPYRGFNYNFDVQYDIWPNTTVDIGSYTLKGGAINFQIQTPQDLFNIRYTSGQQFELMNDIDLLDFHIPDYVAIDSFENTIITAEGQFPPIRNGFDQTNYGSRIVVELDGKGYSIQNFTFKNNTLNNVGLFSTFGYTDDNEKVIIKSLNLKNIDIEGADQVGGVVGMISGHNFDDYELDNVIVEGNITATGTAGGIAGVAYLNWTPTNIKRCGFKGNIDAEYAGGIVGYGGGNYENCFAKGDFVGSSSAGGICGGYWGWDTQKIKNCYFAGTLSAPEETAPIAVNWGYDAESVVNCYYNEDIDAGPFTYNSDGENARTTAEMTYPYDEGTTYINWDFEETWGIHEDENDGYPNFNLLTALIFQFSAASSSEITEILQNYVLGLSLNIETEHSEIETTSNLPIVRTNSSYRENDRLYMSGTLLSPGPFVEEMMNRDISGFFQYASEMFELGDFALNKTSQVRLPDMNTFVYSAELATDVGVEDTEIELVSMPSEFEIEPGSDDYKYLLLYDGNKQEQIGYSQTDGNLLKQVDRGIMDSRVTSFLAGDTAYRMDMVTSFTWEDSMFPAAVRTDYKYRAGVEIDSYLRSTGQSYTFTIYGGERVNRASEETELTDLSRGELFLDARDLDTTDKLLDRAKLKFEEFDFEGWQLEEFKEWVWDEFKSNPTLYFDNMTLAELIKIAAGITNYTERDLINNYNRDEIEQIISDKLYYNTTAADINSWAFDVSKLVARLLTNEPSGAYNDWTETEVKDLLKAILTNEFSFGDFEDNFPFDKWESMMEAKLNISINRNTSIEVEYNQYGPYNYMIDFNLGDIVVVEYPGIFRAMTRIIEVKEEHTVNEGKKYTLTLGKEFETLIGKLKSDKDSISGRL